MNFKQNLVPTARLELAQLSPLPPQDSVSTNFTTSADVVLRYYSTVIHSHLHSGNRYPAAKFKAASISQGECCNAKWRKIYFIVP